MNDQKSEFCVDYGRVRYYIDYRKVNDALELGVEVEVTPPRIKNNCRFGDAGIDLAAAYAFTVEPHSYKVVDTYIGFEFPYAVFGTLWPRGGDEFLLGAGVIDTGYTGTIKCKIINPYNLPMVFNIGDSVGQLVLMMQPFADGKDLVLTDKDEIRSTKRGGDGRIVGQTSL